MSKSKKRKIAEITPDANAQEPKFSYIHLVFTSSIANSTVGNADRVTLTAEECVQATPHSIAIPAGGGAAGYEFSFAGNEIVACLSKASILGYTLASQSTAVLPGAAGGHLATTIILSKASA